MDDVTAAMARLEGTLRDAREAPDPDPFDPCGRGSGCFVVFGGEVAHNETWHRLQDVEAENEHLRRILSDMLAAFYAEDEDRARALRAVAREAVEPSR